MMEVDAAFIEKRVQKLTELNLGFKRSGNVCFVVENSLCHGCGTCQAICPNNAIEMQYSSYQGIYLPNVNEKGCTACELCVLVCSGIELDLTERNNKDSILNEHPLVGPFMNIYRAFTTNDTRRNKAASGGMVTEIVDYLMGAKMVDGAILTRMRSDFPLKAEGFIARTADDLIPSQKSKYCPVPLNAVFKNLIHNEDGSKYVFVGLPHHVHGLRLMQNVFPHMRKKVPYVVSLFTAHVPSQRATEFILYKKNINPIEVKLIEYRGSGNPGRMRILTKNGKEYFVPHLHWIYYGHNFPLFFYPVREWLYFDKLSEWADFSCGDNWMHGLKEQEGASTVITRSNSADRVIQELLLARRIDASYMSVQDLVTDQELKSKLNIGARLQIWKWLGRKIPAYNRDFERTRGELLRTFRFAIYVLLCEHKLPFSVMDLIIKFDYYFRAVPKHFLRIFWRGLSIVLPYREPAPVRIKKYKILLIGGYGHKDIGDEAMPHAIRINLRNELSNDELDLVMLSVDPECTTKMHGEKSKRDFTLISHNPGSSIFRKTLTIIMTILLLIAALLEKNGIRIRLWPSAREALDEIVSTDFILNVGGGNINSIIPSELYKKCTTYFLASILGKPVYLSGQTMGPFRGYFSKLYSRFCLNKVKMISFRDKETSHNRLLAIGVTKPAMFDAADDAITLEGIPAIQAQAILEEETGVDFNALKSNMLIFLNLKASLSLFKGEGRKSNLDREIALMAKIADAIIDSFGCYIVYVSSDYSKGVDDRICHEKSYNLQRNKDRACFLTKEYCDKELIGIIRCADLVIGGRYHFNVFAASQFVPFLGIASGEYQRTKLHGLANLCELPECYVNMDMEFAKLKDVWSSIVNVFQQRTRIRMKLKERIPYLKQESFRVVYEAVQELKKPDAR